MSAATIAWQLTRDISPRGRVRVPVQETSGTWINAYPATYRTADQRPDSPWAMYLADARGVYRFLCFDFDAKHGNAQKDAARLCAILDAANIRRVAATSGPSGGRHVWVALTGDIPHPLVMELAQLSKSLWSTLDISPLMNPVTGAVRPPYSPHRESGAWSRPDFLDASCDALRTPEVTAEQLRVLANHLKDLGAELPAAAGPLKLHGVRMDEGQGLRLTGGKRELSARVRALLHTEPDAHADHSTIAAAVLAGLARARYTFAEVEQLAETAPGLEHLRTMAHPAGGRQPRTARGAQRVLERKWRYAVQFVATSSAPPPTELDDDFESREESVVDSVAAILERADARPGRWRRAGHAHRLVLEALCLNVLLAVQDTVELDVRRLALTTGYSRQTCATALHALRSDGWVEQVEGADGVHAARWRLSSSTGDEESIWTQGVTRAPLSHLPRETLAALLDRKIETERLPIFAAPGSLGRFAGAVAAALPNTAAIPVEQLSLTLGCSRQAALRGLRRLHRHGLVARLSDGTWLAQLHEFTVARTAEVLGVTHWHTWRTARIDTERYVWAWWIAEVTWMRRKGKRRDRRRGASSTPLFSGLGSIPSFPRYPRTVKRRGDHVMARALAELRSEEVSSLAA